MDGQTLDLLEFEQVLEIITGFAQSLPGREAVRRRRPEPQETGERLLKAEESLRFQEENGRIPCDLESPASFLKALAQARPRLSIAELLVVKEYLSFARAVRSQLDEDEYPHLAGSWREIPFPAELLSRIETSLDKNGEVRESAHPELKAARQQRDSFRKQALQRLDRFIRGAKAKYLVPDPYVTQRAGRNVLPVRIEHQREIPGIIQGSSSSGATVFVEPLELVDLNNQIAYFAEREQQIIEQVLDDLSQAAAARKLELRQIVEAGAELDACFAVAGFAQKYRCTLPVIGDNRLTLRQARHPLLTRALGEEGVVPIDVDLGPGRQVLVISGPNTGGKTAALKSVGLLSLMAYTGLPVPAVEAAIPRLKGIFADIGDHQSITEQLSSFSAHVERVKQLVARHQAPSLILLDEVGRGTDPLYGSALAVSMVDYFREAGSYVLATTHHQSLKSYAASAEGVRNASVGLTPESFEPTYRLEFDVPGGSSGLRIAERLGLTPEIIRDARSRLDPAAGEMEAYLNDLRSRLEILQEREEQLEEIKRSLRKQESELQRRIRSRESQQREKFEKELERLGSNFLREARGYLEKIEDRRERRETRRQLQMRETALKEAFRRTREMEKGSDRIPDAPERESETELQAGDIAYHRFFRTRGKVLEIGSGRAYLEIGGKTVTADLKALQKVENRTVTKQPSRGVSARIVQDTDPELNLIGWRVEEALPAVDKFLDRAVVSQLQEVILIHGFGTGKLRGAISQLLTGHRHVESFTVEGGATRVELRS